MKTGVHIRERNRRWALAFGAIEIFLLLALAQASAQPKMTHEELMRRARGGSTAKTATNVITTAPATSATRPQPSTASTAPASGSQKTKGPVFSNVLPDGSIPPAPTSPAIAGTRNAPGDRPDVPAAGSTNIMDSLDATYRLAIGDRLSFRIVEDEEDPKPLGVMDSGELEVPYLGRFRAVNRTCRELALALKAELEKEYYYQATVVIAVDLMARSRGKVYLVGPVRVPGPLEVPSDETLTLSKAILRAGGFTDFADRRNVKVTRKSVVPGQEDETFAVNVAEILEKGKTDTDMPLEPGDLIYVPEKVIRF